MPKPTEPEKNEGTPALNMDLRVREAVTTVVSNVINDYVPTQDSPLIIRESTTLLVNAVMSDYKGELKTEQILAENGEKPFLPQPAMLAHWSEDKKFQQLKANDNKLSPEDVAGKYVLTYYPPAAQSWTKRTTENIADTSNKHWYSHCKSSIYDDNGKPIASANPEAAYNDVVHDATVYVPEDSYSYVIDYKKLGLNKDDITEGFKLQSVGINIMSADMQNAVFRLKAAGMNTEDIIALWQKNTDIANPKNIAAIEKHLKAGNSKTDLSKLKLVKSDNKYRYNLQDNSCAIQPTAPVLFATAAKIKRENMSETEADKLRKNIGLYNIYDTKNYGKINETFYNKFEKDVFAGFSDAVKEEAKRLMNAPADTMSKYKDNIAGTIKWGSMKTAQWAPRAMEVLYTKAAHGKEVVEQWLKEDAKKAREYLSSLKIGERVGKYIPNPFAKPRPENKKKKTKTNVSATAPRQGIYQEFRTRYSNAKKWVSDKTKKLAPKATGVIRTTKEAVKKRMAQDAKRARDFISSFSVGKKVINYFLPDETPTPPNNSKKR